MAQQKVFTNTTDLYAYKSVQILSEIDFSVCDCAKVCWAFCVLCVHSDFLCLTI